MKICPRNMMFTALFSVTLLSACGNRITEDHSAHNNSSARITNENVSSSAHDSMGHGAGMDHSGMQSSPGAASAPFELQFLDTMIAHHQGAVDMAQLADVRAQRQELKELAANIISDQEREIAKMSEWRDRWFEGKPQAINMAFPGMLEGMKGMDIKKLESLKGNEFDIEFVRQMIPHHEGAIVMAKALRASGSKAEVKELAEDIITAQEKEIKQMQEWLSKWAK
jgi:uncharacterized protein (DUF305 family)